MQYLGLNKRVEPNDIKGEESQDCSNCRYFQNTAGLLGNRPGRSFVSNTAASANYTGLFLYSLPNNNRRFISTFTDGSVTDSAAVLSSNANTSYGTYGTLGSAFQSIVLASSLSATCTYPSTSGEGTATFTSGAYTPNNAFLINRPDYSFSWSAPDLTNAPQFSVSLIPLDSGGSEIGASSASCHLIYPNSQGASSTGSTLAVAITSNAYSIKSLYFSVSCLFPEMIEQITPVLIPVI